MVAGVETEVKSYTEVVGDMILTIPKKFVFLYMGCFYEVIFNRRSQVKMSPGMP